MGLYFAFRFALRFVLVTMLLSGIERIHQCG